MSKTILKTCLPKDKYILPVYLRDCADAWEIVGGSPVVTIRAVITDYPHMTNNLSDISNTFYNQSSVSNYSFEYVSGSFITGSIPDSWGGQWYNWGQYVGPTSPSSPYGFDLYFNPRTTDNSITIPWKTARSSPRLLTSELTNRNYSYITSASFTVISGSEYSTSVRFLAGIGRYESSAMVINDEDSYSLAFGSASIVLDIDVPEYSYSYLSDKYMLLPDYGAVVYYTISGSTFAELIASGRGPTSNEINPYTAPIAQWKSFKSSFVPEGTAGTSGAAYVYIYVRDIKVPIGTAKTGWYRPTVHADTIIITPSLPYITQTISSSSVPLDMDSYSSFSVDSPLVTNQTENMIFTSSEMTTTACIITVSGSTTSGSHRPGIDDSNDSFVLQFGKDEQEIMWSSWIPFSTTPLTALTEGVRITSACLVMSSTKDVTSTPSKTCYVTTGLEKTALDTSPSYPTSFTSISSKPIMNSLNVPILDSWVLGEDYYIDITESVKGQLGKKAIYWGGSSVESVAAIVKNNNSTVGGYRQIASGSHIGYSVPKLSINYIRNSRPRNSLGLTIRNLVYGGIDYKEKNHYIDHAITVGGSALNICRGLLYFDLSSLPSGSISSASITLHQIVNSQFNIGTATYTIYPVSKKWDFYGVTWKKAFGAGGSSLWNNAGGDFYSGSPCGSVTTSAVTSPANKIIPISTAGITVLNNMKNNSVSNYGFIIKDTESSNNYSFFVSGNHTSVSPRPKLSVVVNGVTYHIQYSGPAEDVPPSGGGGTPPVTYPTKVALAGTPSLVEISNDTCTYTIQGAENAKRYLLVTQGWSGIQAINNIDAQFLNLKFNGVAMTPITGIGPTFSTGSDEACIAIWGIPIPDTYVKGASYSITGTRTLQKNITLFIREFVGVNPISSITSSFAVRAGANSTLTTNPAQVTYLAKGYVVGDVFLDESNPKLGLPTPGANQASDGTYSRRGHSHYTIISDTSSGNASLSFSWTSAGWTKTAEGANVPIGSDNALAVVSLAPAI